MYRECAVPEKLNNAIESNTRPGCESTCSRNIYFRRGHNSRGIFVWLSMKDSNSRFNLLASAALVVAGIILFSSTIKTILKY